MNLRDEYETGRKVNLVKLSKKMSHRAMNIEDLRDHMIDRIDGLCLDSAAAMQY